MNSIRMHQCANNDCLSQEKIYSDDNRKTFTRTIYQVDATKICQLVKENEKQCLFKSFGQLLYLASLEKKSRQQQQQEKLLVLNHIPDLISIAIQWNPSLCTTSNIEDLVSIIDPFICLRELFHNVTISNNCIKQVNLIGLICFYGSTIEVFFSYEISLSQWLFCFDGNITIINNWNDVRRKCIDFHLQPFLLIYGNSQKNSIDITQLLKRTLIQTKIKPSERRLDKSMTEQKSFSSDQNNLYSFENLSKISSFATLNSSMLFMPKTTANNSSSYINQETVAKVMQQQLLKKESLSDVLSISSSSSSLISSPLVHIRQRYNQKQKFDDTLSTGGNSSTSSTSQRDSGLSSGIHDGSSDNSSRNSFAENNEQIEVDSLIKQTENINMSLISCIEHYLEQSLKYESSTNYSSALESCQQALVLLNQILHPNSKANNSDLSIYARTRKNSLLLRIRTLKKRKQLQQEEEELDNELILTYKSSENIQKKKNENSTVSILSSTKRLSRPKKNVKFSDNVALIVPTSDDRTEPPSEHLIHSFLRNIHQRQTTSDSDSDTPSSSSSNDIPIGLIECSLCHKRFLKNNPSEIYCPNCHYYMQRFRPTST